MFILLGLVLLHFVNAALPTGPAPFSFARRRSLPVHDLSPLKVTSNSAPITRRRVDRSVPTVGWSAISIALKGPGHARLPYRSYSQVFNIKVEILGESFELILDTRSSDTWIVKEGFTCLNGSSQEVSEAYCAFGSLLNGTYPAGKMLIENYNITYSNGLSFYGDLGLLDVTVAGLHVKDQTIALVKEVEEPVAILDNVTSGLLGLAYSTLTRAFVGEDGSLDNITVLGSAPGDHIPYSPMVQTMIAQGLNPSLFSLALQRAKNIDAIASPGGYVAFGGLPPVAFDPVFSVTPLEIYDFVGSPPQAATNFSFYTITPTGYTFIGKTNNTIKHANQWPTIIDSGTLQMVLPHSVYKAYIKSISPPPLEQYNSALLSGPFVPCYSTVPDLGVEIAGTSFNIIGEDLILPYLNFTIDDGDSYCSLALYDATVPLLGGGTT